MANRTCSIDGCTRKHYGKGLCNLHWRRVREHGTPDLRPRVPTRRLCSIEGCDAPHQARGWCKKHHERWRRHGNPNITLKRHDRTEAELICAAPGCARPSHCAELCSMHYSRLTRHGSLEHPHPRGRAPSGQHWCAGCRSYKDTTCFYKNRSARSGLGDYCKACQNAATRDWLRRHPEWRLESALARRSGVSGADSEPFTRLEIAERDGWLCQICLQGGRSKNSARIGKKHQWPHPRSLSLDHIIPLHPSNGEAGSHTRANVQAAHLGCNWAKNNRGCDQLRLIG